MGAAALRVAQAVAAVLPERCVVGCSGGADSLALALGAHWAGGKRGSEMRVVVVDHGLQPGSDEVAARVVDTLTERGLTAETVRVAVEPSDGGLEAAARDARLAALTSYEVPVLLGHTLDDQAETVLLGMLRGSGTRSLAGMRPVTSLDTPREVSAAGIGPGCSRGTRDPEPSAPESASLGEWPPGPECAREERTSVYRRTLLRPLLGLRRTDTEAACRDWGVIPWQDPMNEDPRFARVAIRQQLASLTSTLGRDLAPALARTAQLARADADLLDRLATEALPADGDLPVEDLAALPDALRWRVLHRWLGGAAPEVEYRHVLAVDTLLTAWRGQGPIAVPGARVLREAGTLRLLR